MSALGFWQIQRRGAKQALLQAIQAQYQKPPRALSEQDFIYPPPEFTRLLLVGEFVTSPQQNFLLHSRVRDSQVGLGLVRILWTDTGRAIAVDLGWVRRDFDLSALGEESVPPTGVDGLTSIDGIVRYMARPNVFVPDNKPAKAEWHWIDLAAMGAVGEVALPQFYISTQRDIASTIANNHLQYALTWFGLAITVAVMAAVRLFIGKN